MGVTRKKMLLKEYNRALLSGLKKRVDKFGLLKVTLDLGYHAPLTLKRWFAAKKIPKIAIQKVEYYFENELRRV